MFCMKNKENRFPMHTLIWRPVHTLNQMPIIPQKAVQSVMPEGNAESPTSGVPPPLPAPVTRSPGQEFFSSGIFSDPIPWRSDANVFDSAAVYDPGSASGPGPGTSTAYGSGATRMLHFKVEYRDRNLDVVLKDTDTVGKWNNK